MATPSVPTLPVPRRKDINPVFAISFPPPSCVLGGVRSIPPIPHVHAHRGRPNPHLRHPQECQVSEDTERALVQELEEPPQLPEDTPELDELQEVWLLSVLRPLLLVLVLLLVLASGRQVGLPLFEPVLLLFLLPRYVTLPRTWRLLRTWLRREESPETVEPEPVEVEPRVLDPVDEPPQPLVDRMAPEPAPA